MGFCLKTAWSEDLWRKIIFLKFGRGDIICTLKEDKLKIKTSTTTMTMTTTKKKSTTKMSSTKTNTTKTTRQKTTTSKATGQRPPLLMFNFCRLL